MNYETFKDDNLRLYAVTRCLEIISGASRRLPDGFKARHASIEWRDMAAAGNIYRHEYEDVAARRVWRTLTVSLQQLLTVVEGELQSLGQSGRDDNLGMSSESQITWVALKLEFPDESEAHLQEVARDAGLSLKCYCVRVLLKHLLKDATPQQDERWRGQIPVILRRNGCDDRADSNA